MLHSEKKDFGLYLTGLAEARQTGVIAQEVQRVLPDAVSTSNTNRDGGGVDSSVMTEGRKMLLVDKERIFLGEL